MAEREEPMLGNVGLPNSYPTAFPDMRAIQRGVMDTHPMGTYPEPDRFSSMEINPPVNRTNVPGNEPTPLVGPGNTPNPPVTVVAAGGRLPEPAPEPGLPQGQMSPQAMGVVGASVAPMGIMAQPGTLVKPPLIPGLPSAMVPNTPPDVPGFGSR